MVNDRTRGHTRVSPDSSKVPNSAVPGMGHASAHLISKEPVEVSSKLPPIKQRKKVRLQDTRCENVAKATGRPQPFAGGGAAGDSPTGPEERGRKEEAELCVRDQLLMPRYQKFISVRHDQKQDVGFPLRGLCLQRMSTVRHV